MGAPNNPYAGGNSGIPPIGGKPEKPKSKNTPVDMNHPVVMSHILSNIQNGMPFHEAVGDAQQQYGINDMAPPMMPGIMPAMGGGR